MNELQGEFPDLDIVCERIAVVTITREAKRNALSFDVIAQIGAAIEALDANDDVRVIILTGAGKQAFAAGADISELATVDTAEQAEHITTQGQTIFGNFARRSVPIIAALNGAALGGGLELAMACDLRVAVATAKLGLPEATLGLLPGFGGTQRLAQLIGPSRAMQMIFTARPISAQEAERSGLVDVIATDGDALAAAQELAEHICDHPRSAVAAAKSAIQTGLNQGVHAGFAQERALFAQALLGQDGRRGVSAFLARRSAS